MKRVLITGASGFIGRHTVPVLLSRDYEVHAISTRARAKTDGDGVIWHQADLFDQLSIQTLLADVRPTHLLHLAWYTEPGKYWTALENYRWVTASTSLAMAFSEYGGQRLVAAGSCAEYDWRYGYCVESVTPCRPESPYGVCKHALSQLLESQTRQAGISHAWARIFFLFGPHEQQGRLVPDVVRSLLQGRDIECTHGMQLRDFLYVKDVAAAFAALLDSELTGTVNIASGRPVALSDIINAIAENIGSRGKALLGAKPVPNGEPPMVAGDATRLRQALSWSPMFSLDEAIDETIAWWKMRATRETK